MDLNRIELEYFKAKANPSDINEHMEVLYAYSRRCGHVTELGVRSVVATWAFLRGAKIYRGYDMFKHPNMDIIPKVHDNAKVIIADVLEVDIEPTDFLFIDTFHTKTQLERELKRHAGKASKYIGFHDTCTYAIVGEAPYEGMGGRGVDCGKGLSFAIDAFLLEHPEWKVVYKTDRNNGLTILDRK